MPFKTRRHKLAAAARRFTFSDSGLVSYQVAGEAKEQPQKILEERPQTAKTSGRQIENLNYVGADLLKILLLASLIIASQIALSFVRA